MGFFSKFNPINIVKDIVNTTSDVVNQIVDVTKDIIDTTIDVTENVKDTLDEAYDDAEDWVKDDLIPFIGDVLDTEYKKLIHSHDLISLVDNPKKFFTDSVRSEFYLTYYHVSTIVSDDEKAAQISYYTMMIGAAVASYYLGPEFYSSVNMAMAIIMEQIATQVALNAVVATTVYIILTEMALFISNYAMSALMTSFDAALQSALYEFYNHLYGQYLTYKQEEKNRNKYVSMYMDGSINDWMAGGELYDSPRAGNVLFNPIGNLNTTVFMGLQNYNSTPNLQAAYANPNVANQMFGNLAGNDGFSVLNFG